MDRGVEDGGYAALVVERDDLRDRVARLSDALEAATAYVELSTGNGVRKQPPAWAILPNGEFDAQLIADRGRSAMAVGMPRSEGESPERA